jgi:predicted PurR-regulated permease PerM
MWLTGVGDPILLGTIAFLLNFVQILGPLLNALQQAHSIEADKANARR